MTLKIRATEFCHERVKIDTLYMPADDLGNPSQNLLDPLLDYGGSILDLV